MNIKVAFCITDVLIVLYTETLNSLHRETKL